MNLIYRAELAFHTKLHDLLMWADQKTETNYLVTVTCNDETYLRGFTLSEIVNTGISQDDKIQIKLERVD